MNTQTISTLEQIKSLNEKIKSLREALPKKETPQHLIDKRETIKVINNDLVMFSKVHKVVSSYLKHVDSETFKALLSESQLKRFNDAQYRAAVKSFKTVLKVTQNNIAMSEPYSTSKYFNDIIKVSCISKKVYDQRRKS